MLVKFFFLEDEFKHLLRLLGYFIFGISHSLFSQGYFRLEIRNTSIQTGYFVFQILYFKRQFKENLYRKTLMMSLPQYCLNAYAKISSDY